MNITSLEQGRTLILCQREKINVIKSMTKKFKKQEDAFIGFRKREFKETQSTNRSFYLDNDAGRHYEEEERIAAEKLSDAISFKNRQLASFVFSIKAENSVLKILKKNFVEKFGKEELDKIQLEIDKDGIQKHSEFMGKNKKLKQISKSINIIFEILVSKSFSRFYLLDKINFRDGNKDIFIRLIKSVNNQQKDNNLSGKDFKNFISNISSNNQNLIADTALDILSSNNVLIVADENKKIYNLINNLKIEVNRLVDLNFIKSN